MTPEQLQAQAVEMAKVGKPSAEIARFFVDHNIDAGVAAAAAAVTVSNYAPKIEAPSQARMTQEFFESEVVRLREILNHKCAKYYDADEVTATIQEWRDGLVDDVLIFNVEEAPMSELFGSKVRTKGSSQGTSGTLVDHGVISVNLSLYEKENHPFRGLDHEPYPPFADFNSVEEYQEALEQQREREINQRNWREHSASLLFVKWYSKQGQLVCQGWHNPETLETVGIL